MLLLLQRTSQWLCWLQRNTAQPQKVNVGGFIWGEECQGGTRGTSTCSAADSVNKCGRVLCVCV
jgi:hypothetical protein